MSLFDKILQGTSSKKSTGTSHSCNAKASNNRVNQPKQIWWQCKYCGRKTATWSNSLNNSTPKPGICDARGKTNTGFPKPHEWHKVR